MDAKTLCLAALSLREASGYEIKKALGESPFDHFQDTGFGSIYPALTRLAQEGLIAGKAQPQDKRPDKKVYGLTEAGRRHLAEALLESPNPDRFRSDFLFLLFMSDLMPRQHLAEVIDRRIAEIDAKLEHMESCADQVVSRSHRFVFDLGRQYYRLFRDYLEDNKHWLLNDETDPARLVAE